MARVHPVCRQKSVTGNFSDFPRRVRLDADVTAMDTTQARVAQHDVANIGNSYVRMLLHYTIKRLKPCLPETGFNG